MNEGMGPEKQYTSISPYTSMASFPIHDHLQLPKPNMYGDRREASYHVYDTPEESEYKVPDDEYIRIPSHPHSVEGNTITFNGDNTSTNIEISLGNDEKERHDYINTHAIEYDRTSNNEYVHIPDEIQGPIPHLYDNIPSKDDIIRDDMATFTSPDETKANNGSTDPAYDRLDSI